ncbi:glycerol-3-phosphate dehydrogenase/oxidase [Lysinibacillus pakistanensis]|uniref:Glycerol-3-phosphate dehydrogenase n=1 Tax=Lysinibacillus pakistanensis TaxID=759811 RepID=A0AAX3WYQ1_9BACI|nr:glycerol-3-phosphate dehydrogenase/oxidase [Lysinibacillus pakistanensis]MDM5232334.1 glycerol-3-phosphate dehydrogenase/oxidase [Lysinibacillus pakistanensis]WHY47848.1 glycerol-3-phosphate dehydrogenase/oxidase [Lysinibacillus pakistanensis]WHY52860.1 glycerol-3-phosphate dehydrogenase/oxidase [Lysinibacillus pakistanensis]
MFSFEHRPKIMHFLEQYSFDVLIIGGGITGAGIALDAASRGLSVALIEMQDFSAGTSSRSTKLIHGGLRYLKQFDVSVVAEVGREREIVYDNAVHVTTPEKMLLPLYKKGSLGPLTTSLALKVYDRLAGVKKNERRTMLSAQETSALEPLLNQDELVGGGYYVEYRTDDARLTIEVLKKAVEYGALCINYAEMTEFLYHKKKLVGVQVKDHITGKTIEVHAAQIVNATGPWVDAVRQKDKVADKKQLRLTKGVHIVLDQKDFPLKQAVYFDIMDGRMAFAIPRDGKTYVGTTDTEYEGDIAHPFATQEDVDYLIAAAKTVFPTAKISRETIESSWAGIRPLIFEKGKNPSEISRKDEIWTAPSGLMTIAGGKLTGYRQMAETIVDKIVKTHKYKHASPCITRELSLSGAKGINAVNFPDYTAYKAREGVQYGLNYDEAKMLVQKYGTNVDALFDQVKYLHEHGSTMPLALHAMLLYGIEAEMVYTPSDFFIRRTGLLYFDIDAVKRYKQQVIQVMQQRLHYTEPQKNMYIAHLEQAILDATNFVEEGV